MAGPSYRSLILADSPSLYWILDSTYGATDQSGNGRNGTGAGGVSIGAFSGSPISNETTSTDFDGTDDRITSSYNPFTNGTTRTFEGWAWRDNTSTDDVLVGSTAAYPASVRVSVQSGGTNMAFFTAAGGTTIPSVWPGTGRWVFWVAVFNESANTLDIYIDGALAGSVTHSDAYNASPGNFQVGSWAGVDRTFDGKMAHVAVFERGLTASEIQSHYQRGGALSQPVAQSFVHTAGRGQ